MKITFLGTSHGITEKGAFCSSALVTAGDARYLVDVGAPVDTLLANLDVPLRDLRGAFITHPHQDHYVGLAQLTYTVEDFGRFLDVAFPVLAQEGIDFGALNVFLWGDPRGHERYRVEDPPPRRVRFEVYPDAPAEGSLIFDDGVLRVTAYPVRHIPHSHAFLLEAEGKRVVFTGDLLRDLSDYPRVATETPVDLVVTEAAHVRLDDPDTPEILGKSRTPVLVVSHRAPGRNPIESVEKLATRIAPIKVIAAFDGMTLEV
ncbi:MAG: MBL fold metallo-hydrolase [Clostridia bacterium]|nr:MBL fold metallo-hydrolase [Clostridia bacterium]